MYLYKYSMYVVLSKSHSILCFVKSMQTGLEAQSFLKILDIINNYEYIILGYYTIFYLLVENNLKFYSSLDITLKKC